MSLLTLQTDRVHGVRYVLVVVAAEEYPVAPVTRNSGRRGLLGGRAQGTSRPGSNRQQACRRYSPPGQHRLEWFKLIEFMYVEC